MSGSGSDSIKQDGDEAIDLIDEGARRRFEANWNPHKLSEIESYLPDAGDKRYWATLEELLYIDLEFSWKAYELLPEDETVSVTQSPTMRLKSISNRLHLDRNRDMLQRLFDYEQSLRDKSKKRNRSAKAELETRGVGLTVGHASANEEIHQDFGNYQLLAPLGRGGMGVVYRAIEKKTGRQVALKMIRSNMVARVDEETRRIVWDRFQTEARAVANIEHPNIVTLYDVGLHDQTPFLSMQLVDGEDLASRIRQSVLNGKTAARYMRQVALAIDAAHSKGIIHRDLKPHNILLDKNRREPLVTDFGLAKLTDEKEGLTETGELLGTPGYMSPEQATGKKVDQATDIYSLGATLYCLVGGRPPFQAADTLKTIEQIVKNPPIEPREVNPDVDTDINTICLKCLEKDPASRYASAKDLAEDLDRYLKGEPILARPVGTLERSIRWCRRNPWPTTVGIILVIMIAVVGFLLQYSYTAYLGEQTASQKYLENADLAYESNKKELFLVAENRSLKLPGMLDTRESLLIPLKDFFREFIEINGDYSGVKSEYAFAHFALGKILHELEDSELAVDYLTKGIKLQTEIKDDSPNNQRAILDLSNSLNLRGECLLKLGSPEDSLADFQTALKLRKELATLHPESLEYRRKLANTEMNIGNWHAYRGEAEDEALAVEYYEKAIKTRRRLMDSVLGSGGALEFNSRFDQAKCFYNLAASHETLGKSDEALVHAKESMKILGELHKQRPTDFFVVRDKALCAQLLAEVDHEQDPSFYFAEVADAFLHIHKLYPEEKRYRWFAVDALTYLADLTLDQAKIAEKENDKKQLDFEYASAKESLDIAWNLIKDAKPDDLDQKMQMVNVCLGFIPVHIRNAEDDQAREMLGRAETILNELADSNHPDLDNKLGRLSNLKKAVESLLDPDL